jgi:hypothetical protein
MNADSAQAAVGPVLSESESSTAKTARSQPPTDTKPAITGKKFARKLHGNISSLIRTASYAWRHGSNEEAYDIPAPEDVKARGALLCSDKAEELEGPEAIIAERQPVSGIEAFTKLTWVVYQQRHPSSRRKQED